MFLKISPEAGEMARRLTVIAALAEDLSSVPSTHGGHPTPSHKLQIQGVQGPLLASMGSYTHVHIPGMDIHVST